MNKNEGKETSLHQTRELILHAGNHQLIGKIELNSKQGKRVSANLWTNSGVLWIGPVH